MSYTALSQQLKINMGFNQPPKVGYGFIYILSNESMTGIFKVGLTTNSVSQRIKELNSTGVPTTFKAEKIFEVKEQYLRLVEQSIHRELKNNDLHHGKEFFRIQLAHCVRCVEDIIHKITGEISEDIVGEAKRRKEEADHKREEERRILKKREEQLTQENNSIHQKRIEWIKKQVDPNYDSYQQVKIFTVIGIVITSLSVMVFYEKLLPGILIGIGGWIWIYLKDDSYNKELKKNIESEAAAKYPYKSLSDIPDYTYREANKVNNHSYDQQSQPKNPKIDVIVEKMDRAIHGRQDHHEKPKTVKIKELSDKAIHRRSDTDSASSLTKDEYLSLIKFQKPLETKTWYLSSDGIGHKLSGTFIPMVSLVISDEPAGFDISKLDINIDGDKVSFISKNIVEKPNKFGGDDLISCPKCGQSFRVNLNTVSNVICPMCSTSWKQRI